jgi:hypothetical protein
MQRVLRTWFVALLVGCPAPGPAYVPHDEPIAAASPASSKTA